jgi:hypothetical protein
MVLSLMYGSLKLRDSARDVLRPCPEVAERCATQPVAHVCDRAGLRQWRSDQSTRYRCRIMVRLPKRAAGRERHFGRESIRCCERLESGGHNVLGWALKARGSIGREKARVVAAERASLGTER